MPVETEPSSEGSDGELDADVSPDSGRNSWLKYGLLFVVVGVLGLGLLRPFYPTASALAIGLFLALFGAFVGVLAFRERGRES